MLYREIIAVCSQIHTKHINTLCGQNVELLNVKLAVHIVTTGLQRVKVPNLVKQLAEIWSLDLLSAVTAQLVVPPTSCTLHAVCHNRRCPMSVRRAASRLACERNSKLQPWRNQNVPIRCLRLQFLMSTLYYGLSYPPRHPDLWHQIVSEAPLSLFRYLNALLTNWFLPASLRTFPLILLFTVRTYRIGEWT